MIWLLVTMWLLAVRTGTAEQIAGRSPNRRLTEVLWIVGV
jgi:hypothetical protein